MSEPQSLPRPRGSVALVFDPKLWGHKDVGDNSQFWKPATILLVEGAGPRQTATVRFHHDGRVSRGHFTKCMLDCAEVDSAAA